MSVLFSFSSDYHPIGASPAIYANGTQQYAAFASGAATQELVAVRIADAHVAFWAPTPRSARR